jgi:hypothetical protein
MRVTVSHTVNVKLGSRTQCSRTCHSCITGCGEAAAALGDAVCDSDVVADVEAVSLAVPGVELVAEMEAEMSAESDTEGAPVTD